MTNHEIQMPKEFQMTNTRALKLSNMLTSHSGFGFGHFFDISHWSFVIHPPGLTFRHPPSH